MLLLVVFLSIYQSYTIQPTATTTTTIIIPAQNNKLLIPSTSAAAVGSNGYCEAHSSKRPCVSGPVNV
jgi:hypothetical protein